MNELGMNYVALYRPVRAGGTGGASQIFASQLTLSQRGGGGNYSHYITTAPPRIFRPSYGPAMYIVHYIVPYYSLTLPGSFQAFVLFGRANHNFTPGRTVSTEKKIQLIILHTPAS